MKILYFLRDITDCGGIQQTTCNIINALLAKKIDISIKTLSLYHKYAECFFDLNDEVDNMALFERRVNQYKEYFRIRAAVDNALKKMDFDILIVQGTVFSTFISNDIWKYKKVIVCEHGHYNMGSAIGLHSLGKKIALKRANAIITLTKLDAQNYQSKCKRDIPITNIYNACTPLTSSAKYNSTSKTIVSCGSLDSLKRFDHVILAAKEIHQKHPDWSWEIYGDGVERDNLKKLIDDNSLQRTVILKGYENEKSLIYGGKSFFVLTSQFEGFGMVLIEAMQYGLPLISYDVEYGPKEIIQNGINGQLVENGDTELLAEIVEDFISNENKRLHMSKNCKEVLNKFAIDRISNQWIELIKNL